MLNLFPAIDVIDDNCVRLTKGDFNRVKTYGKAMQIAEKYKQAGFKWLHIIDLEGSRDEVSKILPLALEIKKQTSLKVQLGGGFITIESIQNALKKGIDRILISGLSYQRPLEVKQLIGDFGRDRICFCWDGAMKNSKFVLFQKGWTKESESSLDELYNCYQDLFPSIVFMTNIERDGTLSGVDSGLYEFIKKHYPKIPIGISGGIKRKEDIFENLSLGQNFIIGKALLEGLIDPKDLLEC